MARAVAAYLKLAVAAVFAAMALQTLASAQTLARLHVRSMVMRVDRAQLRAGDTLHLTLQIVVSEHVKQLDNVTLPALDGFAALGDERRCVPSGAQTTCTEELTLTPTLAGARTIAPATLDAIDAKTGKPSQFGSNPVRVDVLPAAGDTELGKIGRGLWAAAQLGLFVIILGIAGALLIWALRNAQRARRAAVPPPPPEPVFESPLDDEARWRTMLSNLRTRPSRARVIAIRSLLRERLGARDDETFGELVGRGATADEPAILDALRLVERATFIDDADLGRAVLDALPALEALVAPKRVGP